MRSEAHRERPVAAVAATRSAKLRSRTVGHTVEGREVKQLALSARAASLNVKPRIAGLPQDEGVDVGRLVVALLAGRADSVTGVGLDAQDDGLAGSARRLQ